VALTEAAKESIWVRHLLIELESRVITSTPLNITTDHFNELSKQWESLNTQEPSSGVLPEVSTTSTIPQVIYADNQGAIKLSDNPKFHARTKHIDIRYHYIRTPRERNEVAVVYIPTADMTADIVLTKALLWEKHQKHMDGMGMILLD